MYHPAFLLLANFLSSSYLFLLENYIRLFVTAAIRIFFFSYGLLILSPSFELHFCS